MKELIYYLVIFILVYLFYFIFVLSRENVLKNFPNGKEAKYLKLKYGLKINDKNIKKIASSVYLANAFILSTTVYVVCLFNSLIMQILVGFVVLILLMLTLYHLIGIIYKNK